MNRDREEMNQESAGKIHRHIDRFTIYILLLTGHVVIYVGLIFFLNVSDKFSSQMSVVMGIWAILVLVPHAGITFFYANRWSPTDFEMLGKAGLEQPEQKHKSLSD